MLGIRIRVNFLKLIAPHLSYSHIRIAAVQLDYIVLVMTGK